MNENSPRSRQVSELLAKARPSFEAVQAAAVNGVALFGAGQFGRASMEYLRAKGVKVSCFIDNSLAKQGTEVDGVRVVSKSDPLALSAGAVLITAKHAVEEIAADLSLPCPKMSFDAWFLSLYRQKYFALRDERFCDARSRECLDGVMMTMLTGDEGFCAEAADQGQYFCLPQFVNTGTEHFVDAGAYVGDTVEKFIWANNGAFRKIYAFEPGEAQMAALRRRKERLVSEWALNPEDIVLEQAGLGAEDTSAGISIEGGHLLGASLKAGAGGIKVRALDSYLSGAPATFIKADVEGMEMELLRGAAGTISSCRPKMALSVYHKPEDLLLMTSFIDGLAGGYKMALRQHSPLLMDTTLYCWRQG